MTREKALEAMDKLAARPFIVGTLRLVRKIPTSTTNMLHVYESDGDVLLQVVGPKGAVKEAVRLSDWAAGELLEAVEKAMEKKLQ